MEIKSLNINTIYQIQAVHKKLFILSAQRGLFHVNIPKHYQRTQIQDKVDQYPIKKRINTPNSVSRAQNWQTKAAKGNKA
jgi:hypothetical protein